MKQIIFAIALIGGLSPVMAQNMSQMGNAHRSPTLEDRVEKLERDAARKEQQRVDCESARGNNWRRAGEADPCK